MFLLNGKHLPEGTSFYDANGTQYPPQWLNQSTEEQKLAIGITWVADPAPFDSRFYWDTDLPKALEDKLEVKINTDAKNEVCYCSPIIKLFGNVTISNLMKIITRPIKVVVHFWINSFA